MKNRLTSSGVKIKYKSTSLAYKKQNKGMRKDTKIYTINSVPLNVINAIGHKNPMNFRQLTTNYTANGRKLLGSKTSLVPVSYLSYMFANSKGYNVEFNNHRLSKYMAQNGECMILKIIPSPYEMDCHHKIPKHLGGSDDYANLVMVHKDMHSLIHAKTEEIIKKYIRKHALTQKQINKLNEYRSLAQVFTIE